MFGPFSGSSGPTYRPLDTINGGGPGGEHHPGQEDDGGDDLGSTLMSFALHIVTAGVFQAKSRMDEINRNSDYTP